MNIGSNILKYGIKAAGVIGAGMCVYDAHKEGLRKSQIEVRKGNADAADRWFENTRGMNNTSNINAKLKDKIFNWELHNNLRGYINAGIGYVKGFVGMLASDIVPVGLSAAAILTKGKTAPKYAGGALGFYALYGFTKNVLGFGVKEATQDRYV